MILLLIITNVSPKYFSLWGSEHCSFFLLGGVSTVEVFLAIPVGAQGPGDQNQSSHMQSLHSSFSSPSFATFAVQVCFQGWIIKTWTWPFSGH